MHTLSLIHVLRIELFFDYVLFFYAKKGIASVLFRKHISFFWNNLFTSWYSSRIVALLFFSWFCFFMREGNGHSFSRILKNYSQFPSKMCHCLPLIVNKISAFSQFILNIGYTKVQELGTLWLSSRLGVVNGYFLRTGSAHNMVLAFRSAPV